jgi:hypothetical protein
MREPCETKGCNAPRHFRSRRCSPCIYAARKATVRAVPEEKVCRDCSKMLPIAAYNQHPSNRDGHNSFCRECGVVLYAKRNALREVSKHRHPAHELMHSIAAGQIKLV